MNSIGLSNFVCLSFLEDYSDTFARNFVTCSKEVISDDLPEKGLLLVGAELFNILFIDDDNHHQEVQSAFKKIIKHTDKAYTILTRTWLLMAKDVIECLISSNGKLNHLDMFLNRIHELSELLTDVYFEESQLPVIQKGNIDTNSAEYRDTVSTFNKYLQQADSDREEGEDDDELKIHTYYHCIPVELNATVRHVDDTSVAFNVHPYEAVALSTTGMGLIKSPLHNACFIGYTKHVDIKSRTATFTHFKKLDSPEDRRAYIRIEPKGIVKAKILVNTDVIVGRISNVSEVAITIYGRNINAEPLTSGSAVHITAELPSVYDKDSILIDTPGTITKIYHNVKIDADAYKIVVHWEKNPNLQSKMAQYVSQRQVEIMRELKELSEDIE